MENRRQFEVAKLGAGEKDTERGPREPQGAPLQSSLSLLRACVGEPPKAEGAARELTEGEEQVVSQGGKAQTVERSEGRCLSSGV